MTSLCPTCGTKLDSLSDLTEHLFIDHDQDDCPNPKCDNGWVEDKHDPERVEECHRCKGLGRIA